MTKKWGKVRGWFFGSDHMRNYSTHNKIRWESIISGTSHISSIMRAKHTHTHSQHTKPTRPVMYYMLINTQHNIFLLLFSFWGSPFGRKLFWCHSKRKKAELNLIYLWIAHFFPFIPTEWTNVFCLVCVQPGNGRNHTKWRATHRSAGDVPFHIKILLFHIFAPLKSPCTHTFSDTHIVHVIYA